MTKNTKLKSTKFNNDLQPYLKFTLTDTNNLYEYFNDNSNDVYAVLTLTLGNTTEKIPKIHLLYVLNMKTLEFKDILVSDHKFKADDVKTILLKTNLPNGSTIITLNCSPFTTYIVKNFFELNNYQHVFYNKNHFTPMIDYTRNYLQGMIIMYLLNKHSIDTNEINQLIDL